MEAGEVGETAYICNGASGQDNNAVLIETAILPVQNEACPDGGQEIRIGLDNGDGAGTADDGVLDADEIDRVVAVCHGRAGTSGKDGGGCRAAAPGSSSILALGLFGLARARIRRQRRTH